MKISAEQLELLKIVRNAERDAIATGRRFYRYYEKTQAPFAERMFKTSTHDATTIGVILEDMLRQVGISETELEELINS